MSLHKDMPTRICIRYADWLVTVPIIRLQMCTIQNHMLGRHELQVMFLCCIAMLVAAFWAEILQWVPAKMILGTTSMIATEWSMTIVDPRRACTLHNAAYTVMIVYGLVFVVGMYSPRARIAQEIIMSILDMLAKGCFSFYIMYKTDRVNRQA